jgi:hypothetical protein
MTKKSYTRFEVDDHVMVSMLVSSVVDGRVMVSVLVSSVVDDHVMVNMLASSVVDRGFKNPS